MLQIVQPYDQALIAGIETDDAAALERKLQTARDLFTHRDRWLKPHERVAVLRRLAQLMEARREHFAMQIARERLMRYGDIKRRRVAEIWFGVTILPCYEDCKVTPR